MSKRFIPEMQRPHPHPEELAPASVSKDEASWFTRRCAASSGDAHRTAQAPPGAPHHEVTDLATRLWKVTPWLQFTRTLRSTHSPTLSGMRCVTSARCIN